MSAVAPDAARRRFRGGDAAPPAPAVVTTPRATHTPTLDRLPAEARSVVVPAVVSLGLVVLSLVAVVVAVALTAVAVDRSGALKDLDRIDRDISVAQIRACEARQDALRDAARDHGQRTGGAPTDIDQLDPGARDFVLDGDGRPTPAPGSLCEGVDDGVRTTGQALADRVSAGWGEVAASVGIGLLAVAIVAFLAAPVALAHWLAAAYRCLPQAARRQRPGHAYTVLRTQAVALPFAALASFAVTAYVLPEEPLTAAILQWIVNLTLTVLVTRALLRVVSMTGDVTFELCHRHQGSTRAMQLSVLGWVLLPHLSASLLVLAGNGGPGWGPRVLAHAALAVAVVALAAPVVFAVALVVAVVLATRGIDRALRRAAGELEQADAHARAFPPSARPIGL